MADSPPLSPTAISQLLALHDVALVRYERTPLGSESASYFVEAMADDQPLALVLSLRPARPTPANADFIPDLLDALHAAGMPVPKVLRAAAGAANSSAYANVDGQRALLCTRLPGSHLLAPGSEASADHAVADHPVADTAAAAAIGRFLACMHLIARPLQATAPAHARDGQWLAAAAQRVQALLPWSTRTLLADALAGVGALFARADVRALPQAVVHGDLFPDNALFDAGRLSGVIDFHHAGRGARIFDLAVTVNAWAGKPDGQLDASMADAVVAGYCAQTPLLRREIALLPAFRAHAALCFSLSRLGVRLLTPEARGHDPQPLLERLRNELEAMRAPLATWTAGAASRAER